MLKINVGEKKTNMQLRKEEGHVKIGANSPKGFRSGIVRKKHHEWV